MPGPDYNPDREGHKTKKFIVQDATRNRFESVPNAPALKFDKWGRCMINDEGLAREIQKENPKSITVTRAFRPSEADKGHTYFFGNQPPMPWHICPECGKQYKECHGIHDTPVRKGKPEADSAGDK